MREILMKPGLHRFDTFKEFVNEFSLGERDLIFTTQYLYDTFIKNVAADVPVVVQEDFGVGEPTEEMIDSLFAAVDYASYDRVVAIGGGAVMDMGKLLVIARTGSAGDLFWQRAELIREKTLVCIPTTAGTGSEVTMTSVAIVKDDAGKTTKLGLLDEKLIADVAVLVPEFLYNIPHRPFAEALIDALIHATESFLSPSRATITSDMFGEKAIRLIAKGLCMAAEGQDLRRVYGHELLSASCYAGVAFLQAGCGIVHGVSYPLSGAYLVTHGAANYIFFPEVLRIYEAEDPKGKWSEYAQILAQSLGCAPEQARERVVELLDVLLPVKTMSEYGVQESDVAVFTDSVFENQMRLVNNAYVPMTREKVEALYRAVL